MSPAIVIGKDGNQVTAHFFNFRNLQLDNCGFGDTEKDAVLDLQNQTGDRAHAPLSYEETKQAFKTALKEPTQ